MRTLTVLILSAVVVAAAVSQEAQELVYPGYRLQLTGGLKGTRDADLTPLVSGAMDKLPKNQEKSRFGLLYREEGAKKVAATVLEVSDAATGKVLREIGIEEWFGKGPLTWQRVPERLAVSPGKFVAVFRPGPSGLTITRTIEKVADAAYPGGSYLRMTIEAQSPSVVTVRASVKAKVEGVALVDGGALTIVAAEVAAAFNPAIVTSWGAGSAIALGASVSGKAQDITITGKTVEVAANQPTAVMTAIVAGTSVTASEHVQPQANELLSFINGSTAKPQLVLLQKASTEKASPSDTVSYMMAYHNIGTAPASEVRIANPIPDGTVYLTGSAAGDRCDIQEERATAQPPAVGAVTKLTWKFKGTIAPGEGRSASFKVTVK